MKGDHPEHFTKHDKGPTEHVILVRNGSLDVLDEWFIISLSLFYSLLNYRHHSDAKHLENRHTRMHSENLNWVT